MRIPSSSDNSCNGSAGYQSPAESPYHGPGTHSYCSQSSFKSVDKSDEEGPEMSKELLPIKNPTDSADFFLSPELRKEEKRYSSRRGSTRRPLEKK